MRFIFMGTTCLFAISLWSAPLWAQNLSAQIPSDQDDLEEIIITGTRFDTPIDQIGRAVTLVTRDDIERYQQRFLSDALEFVPGVQVIGSGSIGALTSVSLRGLPSAQTLVVQDGVVLNDPTSFGGGYNFFAFDTADVERIEVLRGAQSTLYGSNAIGGVINIITQSGSDGFAANALLEVGAFETARAEASVRGGSKTFSNRVSLAAVTSGGFSAADEANGNTEDDGLDSLTLSYRGRYQPAENLSLDAIARYQVSENQFDTFLFEPVDGDDRADTESLSLASVLNWRVLDGLVTHKLTLSYAGNDQTNDARGARTFDAVGTRFSLDYQSTIKPAESIALIVGGEYEEQQSTVTAGFGGNETITTQSVFGLIQVTPAAGLSLNAGIRHDGYDTSQEETSQEETSQDETTFSLSGSYQLPGVGTLLRASYAEGFRAPSAGELGFNPDLNAEFSKGFDLGIEQRFLGDRARISLTYFDQEIDDLIAFDLATFSFLNIQLFKAEGLEVALTATPVDWFLVNASYTYTKAENSSTSTSAGNVPEDRFTVAATITPNKAFSLTTSLIYNGPERSGFGQLEGYTLVAVRGSYQVAKGVEIFARVNNVFDETYQDNLGYGTAPVSLYGGIRVGF